MAVLVLGGAGFIGSRVVGLMSEKNLNPISFDLFHSALVEESIKWVKANVLDLSTIERILFEYEVDSIVHLIGLPAIPYCTKNPQLSFLLNVVSVQNTLEAMRKGDVKTIVFASSAAVYGTTKRPKRVNEDSPTKVTTVYGYHKLAAEKLIQMYAENYGIEYVILRLFNVYGGDFSTGKDIISIFIRKALNDEDLQVFGARKFRDFIHIRDVSEAFVKSLEKEVPNNTFCIGSGRKTTLRALAEIFKEIMGVRVEYKPSVDDGTGIVADISKAKRLLNFSPALPKVGLKEYILSSTRCCS